VIVLLVQRPLGLKLAVGICVDALHGPFSYVEPGSSLVRTGHVYAQIFRNFLGDEFLHPYTRMWDHIADAYKCFGWSSQSNKSLASSLRKSAKEGIAFEVTDRGLLPASLGGLPGNAKNSKTGQDAWIATPEDQENAAKRWIDYGWINYEEKKEDKVNSAIRYARLGLTATAASGALGTISLLLADL